MQNQFEINSCCLDFAGYHYPPLENLKKAVAISKAQTEEIVRTYFTEGIPYAFLDNPILYENIRSWIGKQHHLNPKHITITGSARIGYSLNPYKTIGKKFSLNSDLDLIVVDEPFFNRLGNDFIRFTDHVKSNPAKYPKSQYLRYIENLLTINKSVENGYIDQWKLPDIPLLPSVSGTYKTLRLLLRRMGNTDNSPQPKDATIRIYKDWNSCVNRIATNIHHVLASK